MLVSGSRDFERGRKLKTALTLIWFAAVWALALPFCVLALAGAWACGQLRGPQIVAARY